MRASIVRRAELPTRAPPAGDLPRSQASQCDGGDGRWKMGVRRGCCSIPELPTPIAPIRTDRFWDRALVQARSERRHTDYRHTRLRAARAVRPGPDRRAQRYLQLRRYVV